MSSGKRLVALIVLLPGLALGQAFHGGKSGSSGGPTGSGSSGQVAYWSGASSLAGNANLTFNTSSLKLTIAGTTAGTPAIVVPQQSQIALDGSTGVSVISTSSQDDITFTSGTTNNGTAKGFVFNTSNTLNSFGARYFSFQNHGTEVAYMDTSNTFNVVGNIGTDNTHTTSSGGFLCSGSTHCGTVTIGTATGTTGTATVVSGCRPLCTNTTSATAVKCSVSSTTLTAAEAASSSDVVDYFCF